MILSWLCMMRTKHRTTHWPPRQILSNSWSLFGFCKPVQDRSPNVRPSVVCTVKSSDNNCGPKVTLGTTEVWTPILVVITRTLEVKTSVSHWSLRLEPRTKASVSQEAREPLELKLWPHTDICSYLNWRAQKLRRPFLEVVTGHIWARAGGLV